MASMGPVFRAAASSREKRGDGTGEAGKTASTPSVGFQHPWNRHGNAAHPAQTAIGASETTFDVFARLPGGKGGSWSVA